MSFTAIQWMPAKYESYILKSLDVTLVLLSMLNKSFSLVHLTFDKHINGSANTLDAYISNNSDFLDRSDEKSICKQNDADLLQ